MISLTNEYAVRVITFLGASADHHSTNAQIAKAAKVPAGYLYKILNTLERAGLVRSQRGKHGGYALNRPASRISVLEVITAVDPLPRIRSCPLNLKSHGVKLCPLHKKLDDAFALIEESFRSTTIAELLAEPSTSTPLCETPRSRPPPAIHPS